MKIGLLYPYDEKQHGKDIKEKKDVDIGISARELYDYLNYLEVIGEDPTRAVKKELMEILGIIQVKEENGTTTKQ